jgi:tripartite-type tricarboxylate transporter receptor subunit TctC
MRIRIALLALSFSVFSVPALAQPYPTKPIRVMIGSGAGGLADVTTRLVGQKLTERLGQPVVVENRPSAGGILATQAVATAAPDGHTLMVMVTGNAASKSLLKTLPYDLEKDFAPVTSVAFFDLLVLVKNDSPLKTIADVVALAKTKPGGLNVATTSTGSVQNLTGHLLVAATGVKANIITYKTSGDMLGSVLRGDTEFAIDAYTSLKAAITSKQLRPIVSTGPARSQTLAEVPTMKEAGYKDFEMTGWNSLFAPAGTPPATIALLNKHVREILALPDVQKRFLDLGVEAKASTPEEMGRLFKSTIDKFADAVQRAGIQKQ